MYQLQRNFKDKKMGYWQHPTAGRPGPQSERTWVPRCNFVLKIVATTRTLDASSSGWVIRIQMQDAPTHHLNVGCEQVASTSVLRKIIMKSYPGLIARMTSEDFFEFVESDSGSSLPIVYVTTRVGWFQLPDGEEVWAFRNRILDASGHELDDALPRLIVDAQSPYSVRTTLFRKPCPTKSMLSKLGDMTRAYFRSRSVHALHVYSTVLKAILKPQVMREEHMLPITNVSGPPNVGKTFASAIALRMMGADTMMLSRATASALLDVCDHHINMLVVWDDPRDATEKQLCSIVHEAFHGFPNTTVTKGLRRYNSAIMIGTQRALLGLPDIAVHSPTFSRLAHIDMAAIATGEEEEERGKTSSSFSAESLARCMEGLESAFALLVACKYHKKETDRLYAKLMKRGSLVIDRAVRVAAIEWQLCLLTNHRLGLGFADKDIEAHFCETYMGFLRRHCNRMTPLQQFVKDCKEHLGKFDTSDIKLHVYTDLKCVGTCECVAFHMKSVFSTLKAALVRNRLNYSLEAVQAEVKSNRDYGELSHNVNYKDGKKGGYVTRRSMVIRKDIWDSM
jgi:hypothetical protein